MIAPITRRNRSFTSLRFSAAGLLSCGGPAYASVQCYFRRAQKREVDSLVKLHERDVAAYVKMRRGLARTYLSISGALGCYNQCGSCYHYRSLSYVSSKKLRCFSVCRSIRSDLHCGHRRGRYGLTLHYYCNKLDGHRASPNGTQMMIGIKRYVAKEN